VLSLRYHLSQHNHIYRINETVFEIVSQAESAVRKKDPNVPQSNDEMSTSAYSKASRKASHMD
jgi:hypothetical protein